MPQQRHGSVTDQERIREALRVNQRYMIEIVERYNLCPWAERARREGRVERRVLLDRTPNVDAALASVGEIAGVANAQIGLLIFARLDIDSLGFEHFVSRVRDADAERHGLGQIPFAMAAFHPDARVDVTDPERLVPFLRRTPDPTIQLVRLSVLERVRGRSPQGTSFVDVRSIEAQAEFLASDEIDLRDRIANANLETVLAVGTEIVKRAFDDIRQDRDAAYARIDAKD